MVNLDSVWERFVVLDVPKNASHDTMKIPMSPRASGDAYVAFFMDCRAPFYQPCFSSPSFAFSLFHYTSDETKVQERP